MKHHVEVHASHRKKEWESQSASLIEHEEEVVHDVDIAAQVGRDLFLDEKIPRYESGQGCEGSRGEAAASKIFTHQGRRAQNLTRVERLWAAHTTTCGRKGTGDCYEPYNPCFRQYSCRESRRSQRPPSYNRE